MLLVPGDRLGPYEIAAAIGAGGMGEVYRARDTRLDRHVAIKVLPVALAKDPHALARFEREARAVAALSHSNILGLHDVGREGDTSYVVMELLEGETLRQRLAHGALSPVRAVEIAIQVARGLAAAHAKGIVHRDVKPENLFLTKEGTAKVLDFGLARLVPTRSEASDTMVPTMSMSTEPGSVLGTVGYMSPEQVRGEPVDARSDLFSLASVLHEMLSGRRPFRKETTAETMTAILHEDPPDLVTPDASALPLLVALDRIVRHGLEKDPDARFQSARDLVFALEGAAGSGAAAVGGGPRSRARRRRWWATLGVAAAVAFAAAEWWGSSRLGSRPHPVFRSLTRERGTIGAARFVPGTLDVAYSAKWGTGTQRLYVTRSDQAAPRLIPGFEGLLESISPSGELLGLTETWIAHACTVGRLVSLSLSGGAARPWADDTWSASWGEGGEAAVSTGRFGGQFRLEWPPGHVVMESRDVLRAARVRGESVAFFRERGDTFENGVIVVAGPGGSSREVCAVDGFTGMAWGPDGKELWVSTSRRGQTLVEAIDLRGRSRPLLTHAGRLEIQDVDGAGRALVVAHLSQRQALGRVRGGDRDEDLGWLEAQAAVGLTEDGSHVLLAHLGQWTQALGHLYVRPLAGGPALDFGETVRMPTLSRDGRSIVAYTRDRGLSVRVVPTGPGIPRVVPIPDFAESDVKLFPLPDGRRALLWGRRKGQPFSFYLVDLVTGSMRQVTPDGVSYYHLQTLVSPDGEWMAYEDAAKPTTAGQRPLVVSRVDGRDARPVLGVGGAEVIAGWYRDPGHLFVLNRNVLPAPVDVLDLATGQRTPFLRLLPPDPVGISGVQAVLLAVDGGAYAYNVTRKLSELFLVEGLK